MKPEIIAAVQTLAKQFADTPPQFRSPEQNALVALAAQSVATGTEAAVIEDLTRRQAHGLTKYGVSVAENPLTLREWIQHAYEEHLDACVYLRRAMDEMDALAAEKRRELIG